jgi:type IV pilus assembly protein PilP
MRLATAIAALLVAAFLVGCDDGVQAGPSKSDYAEARKKQAAQAKSGVTPKQRAQANKLAAVAADETKTTFGSVAESYVYHPDGKRDPFRSILLDLAQGEPTDVPRAPLEQFELQQLALTAIIWETKRPRALVTDPGGRSFVVLKGSRIGKNSGRVVHIGDNLVLVKETYVDFGGEQSTKDVEMRIRRSQGG